MSERKIPEVTMYDDWSLWEALKMADLKGNELIVYAHFAKETARKLRLPETSSERQSTSQHQIVHIVDVQHDGASTESGLTQTQVRYAMGKLIRKRLIVHTNIGRRPELYTSLCEMKMAAVHALIRKNAEIEKNFGDVDEAKAKMKARVVKAEKKLRKAKRDIDKCETHLELYEFNQNPREFLGYHD